MPAGKIVLLTLTSDQGDILKDYIQWHLDLGVDLILAQDCNSSDNTQELLDFFSNKGCVQWFQMPDRNISRYKPTDSLARIATRKYDGDWLIMSDVDEFLCVQGGDLRTILECAAADGVTAINVLCYNMTGCAVEPGKRATETLTLRVDRPVWETSEQRLSGELPVPYNFMATPPKTIVRASAFVEYGPGFHNVLTAYGITQQLPDLYFLHYQIRGFDKFQKKITNAAAFFAENHHLEERWGWHWRRWIRLDRDGRLREDYESQFVSAARAEELIQEGVCTVDETISNWIKNRNRDTQ